MTNFYKNSDDLLRDKLTQHEFAQVPGAWDSMSQLLDQQPVVAKRAGGWWWSIPIVAVVTLSGVIGLGVYWNQASTTIAENQPVVASPVSSVSSQSTITQKPKSVAATTTITPKEVIVTEKAATPVATAPAIAQPSKVKTTKTAAKPATVVNAVTTTTVEKTNAPAIEATASANKQAAPEDASDNVAVVNAVNNSSPNINNNQRKHRVKTTRTIVRYQYSMTPLRALQEKRKKALQQQTNINNFGIGDDLNKPSSPIKVGVYGGVSAKHYGATKDFSVMPYGGVDASYKFAPRHGVQVGLQYKSMGQLPTAANQETSMLQYQSGNTFSQAHSINRVDMLEIPLVYQFYPHRNYNIHAGIKGSWLFNTETTSDFLNQLSNEELGIANFDVGILLGMEYCFNKHWSVGLQYSLGFLNLTQQAENMHHSGIQSDQAMGVNTQEKVESLTRTGELMVPVISDGENQQILRLPQKLHNNDIQVRLKYTF